MKYHTALKGGVSEYKNLDHFTIGNSCGFQKDILDMWALPYEYELCDFLYTDIPWAQGYPKFNALAGKNEDHPYQDFLTHINKLYLESDADAVIIAGKSVLKYLQADYTRPIMLNGGQCVAYWYRREPIQAVKAEELLIKAANQYQRVGDMCCGYGRTAKIFMDAGKDFTCSDINSGCIGVMWDQLKGQE